MSYELRFSPQFRKDLQRLDSALHRRILDALGKLRELHIKAASSLVSV
jgi:mRNA-degrading endonuclease RelE of RelBE toxin-antitoxin system